MTEPETFIALYRQNSSGIFRFALHMCGSQTIAEEVTQDTFLMLINEPRAYDPAKGPIGPFLYGIARNLVKRHFERNSRQQYLEDCEEDPPCPGTDTLGDLTKQESLQALREAVAALPRLYREAIVLCDLQELSYESASEVIGCAIGTLRSRLHRGRALLIQKMHSRCLV